MNTSVILLSTAVAFGIAGLITYIVEDSKSVAAAPEAVVAPERTPFEQMHANFKEALKVIEQTVQRRDECLALAQAFVVQRDEARAESEKYRKELIEARANFIVLRQELSDAKKLLPVGVEVMDIEQPVKLGEPVYGPDGSWTQAYLFPFKWPGVAPSLKPPTVESK